MNIIQNIKEQVNTFIDLIITPNAIPLSFNGKDIFYTGGFNEDITGSSGTTTIEKKYYNESPWHSQTTRSEALANFTYNEMCFVLDHFYGLKATRGVSSFDELFASLGLRDDLKNTNSTKYNKALIRFGCSWLFEGHSGLRKFSPYLYSSSYQSLITDSYNTNEYYTRLMGTLNELTQSRQAKGKSVGLRVYNNTAIIAFDQFVKTTQDLSQVYSFYSYEVLHSTDTYWMFRKAFEEIESNSAITNVVIDTTLNVGGMIDALVWLEAFFTSNPAITVRNTFTNQVTRTSYQVDLNRDGTFDSSDTYQGRYRFFLMTSRLSFSCGNAFPTLNKENGAMTIIG